ncbi:hypothetical protein SAMN05443661_11634 [Natronobacterium gregoryi]|nr:hypothetical protein Natgr_2359 [Natronobacterium gregoryi SP2]PLK20597.1 hypothetical protein CYV19_08990 [Natronobacterium gregoryi SP2]SFJ17006.1 hypothetical protein SAMN05443661_11634 [Natronobacterium gregoryi]
MHVTRRAVCTAMLLTAGCVGPDDSAADEPEEDAGNGDGGWLFLHAEVIDEDDISSDYTVLDADDDRIAGRGLYPSLFEAVERIDDTDPIGWTAQSDHTGQASGDGQDTLEAARQVSSESGPNDRHPNDGATSRDATHYVEYDGWTLMVWVDSGGEDE